jgi:CO/xanthine dehydrogenase FAD-binding subunit
MRYEAPRTLEEAIALLSSANGHARVLAGGTDLLIQMGASRVEPELLVDVKGIPELTAIVAENGGFRFGAAVACMELAEHEALAKAWPGVIDAVKLIGSIQVRGRATVGGNLCNASPAADSVPARRWAPRSARRGWAAPPGTAGSTRSFAAWR